MLFEKRITTPLNGSHSHKRGTRWRRRIRVTVRAGDKSFACADLTSGTPCRLEDVPHGPVRVEVSGPRTSFERFLDHRAGIGVVQVHAPASGIRPLGATLMVAGSVVALLGGALMVLRKASDDCGSLPTCSVGLPGYGTSAAITLSGVAVLAAGAYVFHGTRAEGLEVGNTANSTALRPRWEGIQLAAARDSFALASTLRF